MQKLNDYMIQKIKSGFLTKEEATVATEIFIRQNVSTI